MREPMRKPQRGVGLLLEHVRAAEPPAPRRPAYERLCATLGHELAGMLVGALSSRSSHERRHSLVA
jgi:hypothetical protein